MCSRYTIASGAAALEEELRADFQFTYQKAYNAHFGMELPVICAGFEKEIVPFRWGLVPFWAKGPNYKFHHINSPARNIVKHPMCRVPVRRRRCLVLANCFFIWVLMRKGQKVPFVVHDSKQRIMTFAGLWDQWGNDEKGIIRSFSIITTHPNRRLRSFTRYMPVIIPPGRRGKYLTPSTPLNDIIEMLRPLESDSINLYPVSSKVNDFQNVTRSVLLPVGDHVYEKYKYVRKPYRRPDRFYGHEDENMEIEPGMKPGT